ncbi:MAG TPA: phage tail protein, partial [Scandinavium sp.]|uniref:phage tail protein n=1 Tax=Scandinavium sp. TaxID=2830653 RepID=UPI002E2F3A94
MANSPRLGIPKPDESVTPDIPRDLGAAVDRIDAIAMSVDVGPLSSRPTSSPSTPGTTGHAFVVTDQPLTGPRLDVDTGTGFFTAGPAPVDAAPTVPSSRTLGQGAQQACAGNDPRLVGGAQATGDVSGPYPGPLVVTTWGGQNKAQVVASVPPQSHGSSHLQGGTDPIVGITDAQIAPTNKDGTVGTPSLRTLGTGAQQACAGNDPRLVAPSPIGAIVAYSGNGDPPETDWLVADGRLIDRTTYAEFYNRTGHAYNGGVDPGGNKVRIPDKR